MKRIVILLAVFLCIGGTDVGYAQKSVWKRLAGAAKPKPAQKTAFNRAQMLSAKQLQKTLKKRAMLSLDKINPNYLSDNQLEVLPELPVLYLENWTEEMSALFSKGQPWLQKASLAAQRHYFTALNNRLINKTMQQELKNRQLRKYRFKEILSWRIPFTNADVITQTARLIPPQVKQILIGEELSQAAVQRSIFEFIQQLYLRNFNQKIVYFSELMIQEGGDPALREAVMNGMFVTPEHKQIVKWLQDKNIEVVGLEPERVWQPTDVEVLRIDGNTTNIWSSLLGVEWRHRQWLAVIQKYRQKYPDALFIIQAGSRHVDYLQPFTLAAAFKPEETFVAEFEKKKLNDNIGLATVDNSNVAALGWTDEEIKRLMGFDVLISVE